MASMGSMLKQRMRETVGVAKVSSDPDVLTAVARLDGMLKDAALLRKVLMTANDAAMVQTARARLQMVEVMCGVSEKLVMGPALEHYAKFKAVHEYMDMTVSAQRRDQRLGAAAAVTAAPAPAAPRQADGDV
jgi:hypothetical protein